MSELRQFTPDVPLLLRMLQVCSIVDDPAVADAFLVPIPIGTLQASRWHMSAPTSGRGWQVLTMPELRQQLQDSLTHLHRAPARHIFLQTVDSSFIGMATKVGSLRGMPLIPSESIVVHLGDDTCMVGNVHKYRPTKRALCYPRSVVVPYRTFWPGLWPLGPAEAERRPLLVFGSFGVARHAYRKWLVAALNASEPLAPGRLRVGDLPAAVHATRHADCGVALLRPRGTAAEASLCRAAPSLADTAGLARNATFCLCPSGDTPALTQRFYASIFSGCLPVLIDLFDRYPNRTMPQALPFPSLIDWDRFVVRVPAVRSNAAEGGSAGAVDRSAHSRSLQREFDGLTLRLLALEPSAPERRRYMRRVAKWLRWDAPSGEEDAASAAIREIAHRVHRVHGGRLRRQHNSIRVPACDDASTAPLLDCRRMTGGANRLCSALERLEKAPCRELLAAPSLASILAAIRPPNGEEAVATKAPGRASAFLQHDPKGLATLLVFLANHSTADPTRPLRFVSTNTYNGWAAATTAVYLRRMLRAPLHGLAVHNMKAEWSTSHGTRSILAACNLTWRGTHRGSVERVQVFDPPADAALLTHDPRPRSSLSHASLEPATHFLPSGWEQWPRARPFDLCIRFGAFDEAATYRDARLLFRSWCRSIAFHGVLTPNITAALGPGVMTSDSSRTTRVGGFTVIIRRRHA